MLYREANLQQRTKKNKKKPTHKKTLYTNCISLYISKAVKSIFFRNLHTNVYIFS